MSSGDLLAQAIEAVRETRQLSYDLLGALTAEQLAHRFRRPDLDTFGKHFQELGDTQACYGAAVRTGQIDFATIRNEFDHDLVASSARLRAFLEAGDESLRQALEGRSAEDVIVWPGGERVGLVEHLSRLSRHETFHQGQFAIFLYELGASFPESWVETWAMPVRSGDLYRNWRA